jgi:hypothetical protein
MNSSPVAGWFEIGRLTQIDPSGPFEGDWPVGPEKTPVLLASPSTATCASAACVESFASSISNVPSTNRPAAES